MVADLLPTRRRACYPKAEPAGPQVVWDNILERTDEGLKTLKGLRPDWDQNDLVSVTSYRKLEASSFLSLPPYCAHHC